MRALAKLICTAGLALVWFGYAASQPFAPDTTFGASGWAITNVARGNDQGAAVLFQPDGKLLVSGTAYVNRQSFLLTRYTAAGEPDITFNHGEPVITEFGDRERGAQPAALTLFPNGGILLAGTTGDRDMSFSDFALAKYLSDGTPDAGFGDSGKVKIDFSPNSVTDYESRMADALTDAFVLADGTILVAGSSIGQTLEARGTSLARLLPDGRLDTRFGKEGKIVLPGIFSAAVVPQLDGGVLIVGWLGRGERWVLMRLSPEGLPDTRFGTRRLPEILGVHPWNMHTALALRDDGSLLVIVSGVVYPDKKKTRILIARFAADGTPDAGFGTAGSRTTELAAPVHISSIRLTTDGKIAAAGRLLAGDTAIFLLLRLAEDGTPDKSFGTDGIFSSRMSRLHSYAAGLAVQRDGSISSVGSARTGGRYEIVLQQVDVRGKPTADFGQRGHVRLSWSPNSDEPSHLARQPDGRLITAGASFNGSSQDIFLTRHRQDGTLDSSFGVDGKVTTDVEGREDLARWLGVQPDGRIIVVGRSERQTTPAMAVLRYRADGTPDSSFGTASKVVTDFGVRLFNAGGALMQPDGKLVIAGYAPLGMRSLAGLARLMPDGRPDKTFGKGGVVLDSAGWQYNNFMAMGLQADGKILVAGNFNTPDSGVIILMRYNIDGVRDRSFGRDGSAVLASGSRNFLAGMETYPDGRILLLARIKTNTDYETVLLRFFADGKQDAAFGEGGMSRMVPDSLGLSIIAFGIRPDGKIVLTGLVLPRQWYGDQVLPIAERTTRGTLMIGLWDAQGRPDNTAGAGGWMAMPNPRAFSPRAILVDSGSIILGGAVYQPTGDVDAALTRFTLE